MVLIALGEGGKGEGEGGSMNWGCYWKRCDAVRIWGN